MAASEDSSTEVVNRKLLWAVVFAAITLVCVLLMCFFFLPRPGTNPTAQLHKTPPTASTAPSQTQQTVFTEPSVSTEVTTAPAETTIPTEATEAVPTTEFLTVPPETAPPIPSTAPTDPYGVRTVNYFVTLDATHRIFPEPVFSQNYYADLGFTTSYQIVAEKQDPNGYLWGMIGADSQHLHGGKWVCLNVPQMTGYRECLLCRREGIPLDSASLCGSCGSKVRSKPARSSSYQDFLVQNWEGTLSPRDTISVYADGSNGVKINIGYATSVYQVGSYENYGLWCPQYSMFLFGVKYSSDTFYEGFLYFNTSGELIFEITGDYTLPDNHFAFFAGNESYSFQIPTPKYAVFAYPGFDTFCTKYIHEICTVSIDREETREGHLWGHLEGDLGWICLDPNPDGHPNICINCAASGIPISEDGYCSDCKTDDNHS